MADDHTQQRNGGGTLEERIMSRFDAMETRFDAMETRFDAMDVRLNGIDARLSALEVKVEDRLRETRPIWEQALAEINNLTVTVNNLTVTVNDLTVTVNRRFDEVERRLTTVEASLALLVEDVHAVRAKQRSLERRVMDLEQKPA